MTEQPVWAMDAGTLAEQYRQGTLTPVSVLDTLLNRIDRLNPRINALVHLHPQVREQAQASTERLRSGTARSALEGIPVAVKDNILTADMPTCWGTAALRDRPGSHDEIAVARLRQSGAIILGKTNVPEFTLEGYTSNGVYGTTRNPWNTALTPGGSSGGAVAGLAAGLFPLAIGTDGGGSIRRPASHTGVIGLKPSIGAVARVHALPPLLLDFEVVGPLARNVSDLETLFNVIRGPDPLDARSCVLLPVESAKGLRILYVPALSNAPLDPQIRKSVAHAVDILAGQGHQVETGELPFDVAGLDRFWPLIGQVSLSCLFQNDPAIQEMASAKYQQMAKAGDRVDARTFVAGLQTVDQFRQECAAFFLKYDAIVTPAAAALPWPADEAYPSQIDGADVGPRGHAVFTGWVNAAGHPAIALPCRPADNGMPIGMQIVGARGADMQLIRIARQYEAASHLIGHMPDFGD